MAKPAKRAIPEGYHTLTPYLTIRDAAQALDFYKKAFGAEELYRLGGPGGKIMHAEMRIGDSIIMLGEEAPEMGSKSPMTLHGTAMGLMVYVNNVDSAFDRAVSAGATVKQPVQDMFWGDRYGKLEDPFGHSWSMATHKEDLTPEEVDVRAKAFFEKTKGHGS